MSAAKEVIGKVILLNVRLSFPSLFEPNKQKNEDGSERQTWKANFLIPKDDKGKMIGEAIYKGKKMPIGQAIKAASDEAKAKKWGENPEKWPKLKPEKVFLRDGDLESWDGYAGMFYISSNAQIDERPAVVTNRKDSKGEWIEAQPGGKLSPYSGCYVNAVINIWMQDNEHGKRANAKLSSVQFFKDGEPFSASVSNPNDDFTDDMVSSEGSFGDGDPGSDEEEDDDGGLV